MPTPVCSSRLVSASSSFELLFCSVSVSKKRLIISGPWRRSKASMRTRGRRQARSPATRTKMRRSITSTVSACKARRIACSTRQPSSTPTSTTSGVSNRLNMMLLISASTVSGTARVSTAPPTPSTAMVTMSLVSGRRSSKTRHQGAACAVAMLGDVRLGAAAGSAWVIGGRRLGLRWCARAASG